MFRHGFCTSDSTSADDVRRIYGVPSLPENINDVADFPKTTYALVERGYDEDDIRKILDENVLRVMQMATSR